MTKTPRCEIHQPSFRHHLLRQFEGDDACLRFFLRRNTLYLFYPSILMLGEIAEKVHDAFLDSVMQPIHRTRNLLVDPPGELVGKVAGVLLERIDYIEYHGKVSHPQENEIEIRGEVTHEYRINLTTINQIFREERLDFDVAKAKALLDLREGMSEALLIEKYQALHVFKLSHKRARAAFGVLDAQGFTKLNGHGRVWGRDVLKLR